VSRALGIPYLRVEATRARKRLGGPWDAFARVAEAACDAADVVFYLTQRDRTALQKYAPAGQQLMHLRPFLPLSDLPPMATGTNLLAVGMMRAAAKLPSYALIAQTLALVPDAPQLEIAGDGPARAQVEEVMAPLGSRVTFLGRLEPAALQEAYVRAGTLIWPGVDEAFGMTYLFPRDYSPVSQGAEGLAAMLRRKPPAAEAIRAHIRAHHLLPSAALTLSSGLTLAGVR
jgi:hypothetical protein